jgi:hypothetical protein
MRIATSAIQYSKCGGTFSVVEVFKLPLEWWRPESRRNARRQIDENHDTIKLGSVYVSPRAALPRAQFRNLPTLQGQHPRSEWPAEMYEAARA